MYTLTQTDINKIRNIVLDASDIIFEIQAKAKTEKSNQNNLKIESKGFGDYVTEIDLAVQHEIENQILSLFPEFQFFGEEGKREKYDTHKPCFILDPIDGTTNLIRQVKHSCISLAYYNGEKLDYGAIYNPFLDEFFEAQLGKGAYLIENAKLQIKSDKSIEKERLMGSNIHDLQHAIIIFGTCPHDRGKVDHRKILEVMTDAFMAGEDISRTGSAALDLAYIASGRADVFFELKLRPWDFSAGILLCQEAGIKATNMYGEEISIFETSSVFCANPDLHQQFYPLLEKLRS